MFFHVLVRPREHPATLLSNICLHDLDEEQLLRQVIEPYDDGRDLIGHGPTIRNEEIREVLITRTSEPAQALRDAAIERRPRFGAFVADRELMVRQGEDVTDSFIADPPGAGTRREKRGRLRKRVEDPRRVMVVHGRSKVATSAIFGFLGALGLTPIDWEEAVAATGKGSPQNFEAAKAAIESAQATVVVFTPDDLARLDPRLLVHEGSQVEAHGRGQPRPNVLIEAGLAFGLDPDNTILVEIGQLRGASDFDGLNAIRLDNAVASRHALRSRLRSSGCPLNDAHRYLEPDYWRGLRRCRSAARRACFGARSCSHRRRQPSR